MSSNVEVDARRTDTRERILEVASELFAEHGFAGTSIRDIADHLGVTKAALYYHFPSKAEILQALIAEPVAVMREVLEREHHLTDAPGRAQFVREMVGALADCKSGSVAIFKDPELHQQVDSAIASSGITNVVALLLAQGLSGSSDPAEVKPDHLMRAIGAVSAGEAMLGSWHMVNPDCEGLTPEDAEKISAVVIAALETEVS